jgi:aldehyde dehydrogenase (NAD+)
MTDYAGLVARQRAFFASGATRPAAFRREALRRLLRALETREEAFFAALTQDLRKPRFEAFASEIGFVYGELKLALAHLSRWMSPRRRPTPLALLPASSRIERQPLGCTLIVAPWNYPLQLVLAPLVAAVAAGDCAIVKPSELAPATSAALVALLREVFAEEHVAVVEGEGHVVVPALLEHRFDLVFFTGSPAVGRRIAALAAPHLSPIVLELGGKSPCLVDASAHLQRAAERIAWGKFMNAGQTCVAPDYVLVAESQKEALIAALGRVLERFYGPDPRRADYARIIHARRFETLRSYLTQGRVRIGGAVDAADLYIAPTVMDEVALEAPLMQEEIFGPLLPIVPYRTLDEALAFVAQRPYPLAAYVFTSDGRVRDRVLREVRSGGACVNHAVIHFVNPYVPCGGIGPSGMGRYHGEYGFATFSHEKSVLESPTWFETGLAFPPYGQRLRWMRRLLGG